MLWCVCECMCDVVMKFMCECGGCSEWYTARICLMFFFENIMWKNVVKYGVMCVWVYVWCC